MQNKLWNYTNVSNSNYTSIKTKNAICDAMHDKCGGLQLKPLAKGGFSVPLFLSFYLCRNVLFHFIFDENMNNFFQMLN
jgi:hypothetical protein